MKTLELRVTRSGFLVNDAQDPLETKYGLMVHQENELVKDRFDQVAHFGPGEIMVRHLTDEQMVWFLDLHREWLAGHDVSHAITHAFKRGPHGAPVFVEIGALDV